MLPNNAPNKWLYILIALAVVVNLSGLLVPLMNPDATLYATIAKTMVQRNDYVNIWVRNTDWLDKPHFPFWVASVFFKVFGINTWAYKLSGIVFMLMGTIYTWIFAKWLYNNQVALWAVLILLTSQHIILSDNDVRAEPYLTGLIIASVYHFYRSYPRTNYWHLLAACLFAGCAVMTKGIFALITIGSAIAGHLLITRQWRQLFHLRWLFAAVLTFVFILPEVYCLYQQFDVHPEKVVFGRQGVSGIKFFFWDSQFGRFFNTGPIKGSGDLLFFVHTTLWAFLPWSLLLFTACYKTVKDGYKKVRQQEWYTLSGALVTFALFSASGFQLPHYLNIVFPYFAILTAQYLFKVRSANAISAVNITQWIVVILLALVVSALHYFFKPTVYIVPIVLAIVFIPLAWFVLPQLTGKNWLEVTGYRTVLTAVLINFYLNLVFYPDVLKYQAGSEAAIFISEKHLFPEAPLLQSGDDVNFAMEFYLDRPMHTVKPGDLTSYPSEAYLLYAPADQVSALVPANRQVQVIKEFERYPITRMHATFLNKATRYKELTKMKLLLVKAH